MKKFAILLLIGITLALNAAEPADTALFQIRRVLESSSTNAEPMLLLNGTRPPETLNVDKAVLLDAAAVASAKLQTDEPKHPQIKIKFTEAGRKKFAEVSRNNVGKRIAIILAGQICCAPVVNEEITGGSVVISGNFTQDEAKNLTEKINAALR